MGEKLRAVVALGMFDGVHLGHRELISQTVRLGKETGAIPAVYTFQNHPMEVLKGQAKLLSTSAERESILRGLGIEDVWMDVFSHELARLSPEAFIDRLLERWNLIGTVCGFNYTFGDRGMGTSNTLAECGRVHGFVTRVVPPVLYGGEAVSSTRVRTLLEQGDVPEANALLTRPYCISGEVIENKGIGRRIGFPTANITYMQNRVLPAAGVYTTLGLADGVTYPAVTNIGTNPTVGGDKLTVETYLIGFDGALYGHSLAVSFLQRLRGETRFESVDALKTQIAQDAASSLKICQDAQLI